jgi:hypothetical protein
MRQLPLVEEAMAQRTVALLRQLDAACESAEQLEEQVAPSFNQHPDAEITTSFPGLGPFLGARVLAELGDDKNRFADTRAVKAYAGSARSPRPPESSCPCVYDGSKTTASPPPATAGPPAPCSPHPALAPATTDAVEPETATPQRYVTSTTASSAAYTTASRPENTTTRTPLSSPTPRNIPSLPLDTQTPSDVSSDRISQDQGVCFPGGQLTPSAEPSAGGEGVTAAR